MKDASDTYIYQGQLQDCFLNRYIETGVKKGAIIKHCQTERSTNTFDAVVPSSEFTTKEVYY